MDVKKTRTLTGIFLAATLSGCASLGQIADHEAERFDAAYHTPEARAKREPGLLSDIQYFAAATRAAVPGLIRETMEEIPGALADLGGQISDGLQQEDAAESPKLAEAASNGFIAARPYDR